MTHPLEGRTVAPHIVESPRVVFVAASPSSFDVVRNSPISGPARVEFVKRYLEPLGLSMGEVSIYHACDRFLVNKDGRHRLPVDDELAPVWVTGDHPVVALGWTAVKALRGGREAARMPHPFECRLPNRAAEVDRKIARLAKMLKKGLTDWQGSAITEDARAFDPLRAVSVVKADVEKRLTYGIVLEPNVVDLQGDVETEGEIEKAAHSYLEESRVVGESHAGPAPGSTVVESYIAPADFEIGGQPVKKGSWVMVARHDEKTWQRIKAGEFSGYSIGGYAQRHPAP